MMTCKVYLAFIVFRIVNVFLVQSQFDPDEYWQNLEPAYCYVFDHNRNSSHLPSPSCPGLTWEWKRRPQKTITIGSGDYNNLFHSLINFITEGLEGPVRSFVSIVPTLIFYLIIKKLKCDSSWMVSRGPLFVNAIVVAAFTDWTVWYMSQWMKPERYCSGSVKKELEKEIVEKGINSTIDVTFWCVFCMVTSWFNAYTLIRTYSNSLETALLALSLSLVSPQLLRREHH